MQATKLHYYAFEDNNGKEIATKVLLATDSYVDSRIISHPDSINANGIASVAAIILQASMTIVVTCRYEMGSSVGFSPWYNLLDESTPRVNTFSSIKPFVSSLYNQDWFNSNHSGFQLRFTRTVGSGIWTIVAG
jgi:hypothetical protein